MLGFLFIPKTEEPTEGCICKLQDGRVGRVEEIKEYNSEKYCKLNLFYQGKEEVVSKSFDEVTVVSSKYVTNEVSEGDTITYYDQRIDFEELKIESITPVVNDSLEENIKDEVEILCTGGNKFLKSSFGLHWYKEIHCSICKQAIQLGQSVERSKDSQIVHVACSL